VMQLCGDDGI